MTESLRDLLRQGADTVERPELDVSDLVAHTQRRLVRRRLAAVTAGAAAVVLIAAGGFALQPEDNRTEPAPPAPTETPTTATEWTPERIRDEGSPGDPQGTISTESGLATRLYQVCDGTRCDATDGPPDDLHMAIEVLQDGRSAVFDLQWTPQPWVKAFDEDSVLVQDGDYDQPNSPVRYRLLRADGTAVDLRLLDDPAPAVPGPGVVVIPDLTALSVGLDGAAGLYVVDDRAGTLQPMDSPSAVRYWGSNVDEFLWGVTDDCRAFWATAGTFEGRRLDCDERLDFTSLDEDVIPAGWLRPGRMVVTEGFDPGDQMAVHVSLDYGVTWQRIPVVSQDAVADALRQLD